MNHMLSELGAVAFLRNVINCSGALQVVRRSMQVMFLGQPHICHRHSTQIHAYGLHTHDFPVAAGVGLGSDSDYCSVETGFNTIQRFFAIFHIVSLRYQEETKSTGGPGHCGGQREAWKARPGPKLWIPPSWDIHVEVSINGGTPK